MKGYDHRNITAISHNIQEMNRTPKENKTSKENRTPKENKTSKENKTQEKSRSQTLIKSSKPLQPQTPSQAPSPSSPSLKSWTHEQSITYNAHAEAISLSEQNLSDTDTATDSNNNEPGPFIEIADSYAPLIKNLIKRLHIYKHYEEMYQVGLIALWEAWRKYHPEKGSFPALAKYTVKGHLLHELRRAHRYEDRHVFSRQNNTDEDIFTTQPDPNPEQPLASEMLEEHMHDLSERQQLWVQEAVITGKTTADIAGEQNVSTHTVRSWKKEALKKLRHSLQTSD